MGNTTSSPAHQCLLSAVGNNSNLVAFKDVPFYQINDVKLYNLNFPVTPAAVTFPETTEQVAEIVKCAADGGYKVQAKSGGHSYGNYGIEFEQLNEWNRLGKQVYTREVSKAD